MIPAATRFSVARKHRRLAAEMTCLFHQHQEDAIRKAKEGRNYVLTTGTGSGNYEFHIPIVDHVLRNGSGARHPAIIIYPTP